MSNTQQSHENYERDEENRRSSEKSFGFVFFIVFFLIAFYPIIYGGELRHWALIFSGVFLLSGLFFPKVLRPLNILWLRFGLILHKVISPIIMGLLFFVTVTPTGLIMRTLGKDILNLKIQKSAQTYWIKRDPPGPKPDTMKNQF